MKKTSMFRMPLLVMVTILFWAADGGGRLWAGKKAPPAHPAGAAEKKDRNLPAAARKKTAGAKRYSIQTGSFRKGDVAAARVAYLKNLGHTAYSTCVMLKGKGKFYRVVVGDFDTKKEAREKGETLVKQQLVSGYIIRSTTAADREEGCGPEQDPQPYSLHVGSYKQKSNAEAEVERIEQSGWRSACALEDGSGERWFKVYLGQFENEAAAMDAGAALKKKGLISYYKATVRNRDAGAGSKPGSTPSPGPEKARPVAAKTPSAPETGGAKTKPGGAVPETGELAGKTAVPLIVENIAFVVDKGRREIVYLRADRFFSPTVRFRSEKEAPRVLIDVREPAVFEREQTVADAGGQWVKKIQVLPVESGKTLKILLHLEPFKIYKVGQTFDKQNNIYAVEVFCDEK